MLIDNSDSNPSPIPVINKNIDGYNNKITEYYNRISTTKYLFEITKCCGYSEIISLYKDDLLLDLYNITVKHFDYNNLTELYLFHPITNEKKVLPNVSTKIRDFILNNQSLFVPEYKLPAAVVYRIYFGDGCTHEHHN